MGRFLLTLMLAASVGHAAAAADDTPAGAVSANEPAAPAVSREDGLAALSLAQDIMTAMQKARG